MKSKKWVISILSLLFVFICAIGFGVYSITESQSGIITASAATDSSTNVTVDSAGTYQLFNSGCTSSSGKYYSTTSNPAPKTLTNNGYDIYVQYFGYSSEVKATQIGRTFTVESEITEKVTVSIYAYDVDESSGEVDTIYLVDDTSGTSVKVGTLSGMNQQWNTTSFSVDPSNFTTGHTYHLYLSVGVKNWCVWIRTVSIEVSAVSGGSQSGETTSVVQDASISASISTSGTVTANLSVTSDTSRTLYLEFKATHVSTNNQVGSLSTTIAATASGVTKSYSFSLDSGSPTGTYTVECFIKDSSGNSIKSVSCTVSYNASSTTQYYAVNYNANGGSNNLPQDTNSYLSGATVTVKFDYIPSKTGYTFLGWSQSATATEATYTENGNTTLTIGSSDVTLYAVWKENTTVSDGFVENNGNTYYYVNGSYVVGYYIINNNIYYFGTDGVMTEDGVNNFTSDGYISGTQFVEVNNNTYYIVNGEITIGYYIINNNIYYFGTDGVMGNDGVNNFTSDGYISGTKFVVVNNNTYYIVNGEITIGYYIINNNIYYFGTDGVMGNDGVNNFTSDGYISGTQFVVIENNTYYIVNGEITIGYYIINNNIYYFGTDGVMTEDGVNNFTSDGYISGTQFVVVNNNTYYIVNGEITIGYYIINNNIYYFGTDGVMGNDGVNNFTSDGYISGTQFVVIENNTYYIVNGEITIGYYIINNNIYYFGTDGVMGKDGVNNFTSDGYISGTQFVVIENNTYYIVNGEITIGYYIINNNIYYFGTDGVMGKDGVNNFTSDGYISGTQFVVIENNTYYIVNGEITIGYYIINNNIYYFGTDGVMGNDGVNNFTSDGYISGTKFVVIENNTYYIVNGEITIGYYIINNNIYYFGTDGVMGKDGVNNFTSDGYISGTKFVVIENNTYYIVNGEITIGYYIINNNIYYFGTDGVMGKDGVNNFTSDGYISGTKFVVVNNNTYYIVNGEITIGYYIINNNIYYFGTDGVMGKDGVNNFTSDGYIGGTKFVVIENNTYYIVNGEITIGYYIINNNIYYFGTDGVMGKDGVNNFTSDGYISGTKFVVVNNNTYYIVNGKITIGYYIINNNIYYFGTDGVMGSDGVYSFGTAGYILLNEGFVEIDSGTYYLVDNTVTEGYVIYNRVLYICENGLVSVFDFSSGTDFVDALYGITAKISIYNNAENISDYVFSSMSVDDEELIQAIKSLLGSDSVLQIVVYDMSLTDTNGEYVSGNLAAEINLPLPSEWNSESNLTSYWYDTESNSLVEMPVSTDGQTAKLTTTHFSYYVLVLDGESSEGGSTEGGSTEGGSTEGGSTEGGSTEGGSTEGGSTEGGSTEGGSTEGGSTEGGSTEGGSTEGGSTEGGSTEGGSTEGGSTEGGSTEGGTTEGGSTEGGSTDSGTTDSGSTEGSTTDSGTTVDGSTSNSDSSVTDFISDNIVYIVIAVAALLIIIAAVIIIIKARKRK